MNYNHTNGIVKGFDGIDLYSEIYIPNDETKLNVSIIHGFGDHLGRYKQIVEHYDSQKIAFYLYDQRGHGRSSGPRGHVNKFKEYSRDAAKLIKKIKEDHPNIPLIVFGQSMGGLVLLNLLTETEKEMYIKIDGAIVSSPLVELKMKVSGVKKFAANLLKKIAPQIGLESNFDTSLLSHDPSVAKMYNEDALTHSIATPAWYFSMQESLEKLHNVTKIMQVPIMMIVSGNDKLVNSDATIRFSSKFENIETFLYENFYHEALNEIGKEKVFKDMDKWLAKFLLSGK